jgi:hypothetical protein
MGQCKDGTGNDFEELLAEIMTVISKKIRQSQKNKASHMRQLEAPKLISALIANIMINLCHDAINHDISRTEKVDVMFVHCNETFNMIMEGWVGILNRQDVH